MRWGGLGKLGLFGKSIDEDVHRKQGEVHPTISVAPKRIFLGKHNHNTDYVNVTTKVQWNAFINNN